VIWNAFCIPMLWAVSSQEQPFVWLFVIAGAGLAIAAGVLTWRWLRFGRTVFEQTTLPGRLGDRLRGTIQLRGRLLPQKGFRATLSCVRFTSGKNGVEVTQWQEEGIVDTRHATVGPKGTAVPVDFPLPADGLPSRLPGEPSGIRWTLELSADVPGVDFAAAFEVPIFGNGDATAAPRSTPATTASEPEVDLGPILRPEAPMRLDRERYTPDSPNRVLWLGAHGVELRIPPARNKGYAAFITLAAFIWAFFAAFAWFGAPLLFGAVFVAAWFLLIFASLCAWLRRWRVVADASGLSVTSSILGIGWTRKVGASEIDKIEPRIIAGGKRPLYDLGIHRRGGRRITAVDGIRSKRESEWLCAALRHGLSGRSSRAADLAGVQASG
jgi:hypothetical protein